MCTRSTAASRSRNQPVDQARTIGSCTVLAVPGTFHVSPADPIAAKGLRRSAVSCSEVSRSAFRSTAGSASPPSAYVCRSLANLPAREEGKRPEPRLRFAPVRVDLLKRHVPHGPRPYDAVVRDLADHLGTVPVGAVPYRRSNLQPSPVESKSNGDLVSPCLIEVPAKDSIPGTR